MWQRFADFPRFRLKSIFKAIRLEPMDESSPNARPVSRPGCYQNRAEELDALETIGKFRKIVNKPSRFSEFQKVYQKSLVFCRSRSQKNKIVCSSSFGSSGLVESEPQPNRQTTASPAAQKHHFAKRCKQKKKRPEKIQSFALSEFGKNQLGRPLQNGCAKRSRKIPYSNPVYWLDSICS